LEQLDRALIVVELTSLLSLEVTINDNGQEEVQEDEGHADDVADEEEGGGHLVSASENAVLLLLLIRLVVDAFEED
jgi:hypothetical protein